MGRRPEINQGRHLEGVIGPSSVHTIEGHSGCCVGTKGIKRDEAIELSERKGRNEQNEQNEE